MLALRYLVVVLLASLGALTLPASAPAQGGDVDCADFASQADAQAFFDANDSDSDPYGLDADADLIACESNPCPCSSGAEREPPPPPPKPRGYRSERAARGDVLAELSWVEREGRYAREYRSKRIKITRAGQVLVDEALPRPPRCDTRCARLVRPLDFGNREPVFLRDLDADGEPEVVVDLWTGGANCCTFSRIYGFRPSRGTYKRVTEMWGTGYRLRRLDRDNSWQFSGFDERFKYAFACGACGRVPVRIWRYQAGKLSVVTSEFPGVVRRDARRNFRRYLKVRRHPSSFWRATTRRALAVWVADQCLLQRCRQALRTVRLAHRRGELRKFYRYDFGPYGRAYIRKLKRMLRRYGYLGFSL